jgi:hypothetical protein
MDDPSADRRSQHPGEATERAVGSIAVDVDFKPYLEAVTAGSQRARSNVYLLAVALVAMFSAYRTTTRPDWLDARLHALQTAYRALKQHEQRDTKGRVVGYLASVQTPKEEQEAIDYAQRLVFDPKKGTPASDPGSLVWQEHVREYEKWIDELSKQSVANLSIHLPVLGITLDMNDLGVISGLILVCLLWNFHSGLTRLTDNLKRARSKANRLGNKDNLELLIMTSVLSSPRHQKTGGKFFVYSLLAVLVALHLVICITDAQTWKVWLFLQERLPFLRDFILEWGTWSASAVWAYYCYQEFENINQELSTINAAWLADETPSTASAA